MARLSERFQANEPVNQAPVSETTTALQPLARANDGAGGARAAARQALKISAAGNDGNLDDMDGEGNGGS